MRIADPIRTKLQCLQAGVGLAALCLLLVPQTALAEAAATRVRTAAERVLAKLPGETQVGLVVIDADTGAPWFARNPDLPLKPASVQKLFISAAALDRFGPDFQLETQVYLHGDELWVRGGGDPGLGDPRIAGNGGESVAQIFDAWAAGLRRRGVTQISKIVLDDSIFDRNGRHPDWPDDQQDRWYQAPIGGLNLNDNCLDVTLHVSGGRMRTELEPPLPDSLFENRARLGKKHAPTLRRRAGSDTFELLGTVKNGGAVKPVCARRPTVFFGHAVHQALRQRGIEITGPVVRRPLQDRELADATRLVMHTTTMKDLYWRCNTFSQNLFAEALYRALAAYTPDGRRSGAPASWESAERVLRHTLAGLGIDMSNATIRDGCGLSHSNRVTALQVTYLLLRMRRHAHADFFLNSLAQPGEPGSMSSRYNDPALCGRLRAKTGTIDRVRCLAGYLTRDDGTTLIFALLINGKCPTEFPTEVCLALLK